MATKFTTTLHHYSFPSASDPAYKAMVARIKANGEGRGHWMNAWGGDTTKNKGPAPKAGTSEVVEIDPAHIFGNQWNEAANGSNPGRRLFDWYEEYTEQKFKRGHWLEITPELAELRRVTLSCGYCGKHYGPHHAPAPATPFCTACLDSEYLKPEDLHLTRLVPVIEPAAARPALTDAERAELMPRYVERQTTGTDSRANAKRNKQRADVLETFAKTMSAAAEERDGMLWLWDRGITLDNVIYYDHTREFSFGWRSPVSPEVKAKLLDLLCEFPFAYEIKATDGKASTK
jgi:hypothetical protein